MELYQSSMELYMDHTWDFLWFLTPVTNQFANPMAHLVSV